jgi:hypothetical protein
MKVRGFLFFLAILTAPWPGAGALAAGCDAGFAELALQARLEKEIALNPGNLDEALRLILAESGPADTKELSALLRMALENASQHGVEDMYMPSSAKVRLLVRESGSATEIRITNPLFKKFPERLARAFRPGESLALSSAERPFPRGFGLGLGQMFRSFENFPPGSLMEWIPGGDEVTFVLRFPR